MHSQHSQDICSQNLRASTIPGHFLRACHPYKRVLQLKVRVFVPYNGPGLTRSRLSQQQQKRFEISQLEMNVFFEVRLLLLPHLDPLLTLWFTWSRIISPVLVSSRETLLHPFRWPVTSLTQPQHKSDSCWEQRPLEQHPPRQLRRDVDDAPVHRVREPVPGPERARQQQR